MELDLELPTTSWSLLESVGTAGRIGETARELFARRYDGAVHAYFLALARDPERARDLAQAFFADRILPGPLLSRADRTAGSFRCYLRRAARNFYFDELRRERRGKRDIRRLVGIENAAQVADDSSTAQPELAFHEAWIRSLLDVTLQRVRGECEARGLTSHFEIFRSRFLSGAEPPLSWAELGRPWSLDEKAARGRSETVARRFRMALRNVLAAEVPAGQVDEELVVLRSLLGPDS